MQRARDDDADGGGDAAAAPARAQRAGLPLPPHRYTPKHRWSVKLHFLSGITLGPWLSLLWRERRHIEWRYYPHRVLFLTCMAALNTALALLDWLLFSAAVASQPLHPEPLFILGHPRTGTTHLHNLLSRDPAFAFATTFHAGFPSSFLCLEPLRGLLSGLLEPRRPMDAMALDWDLPAEDEIAVNALTGGVSPYMALVLPRLWRPRLRRYLTWAGEYGGGGSGGGGGRDGGGGGADTGSGGRAEGKDGDDGAGEAYGDGAGSGGEDGAAFAVWRSAFLWFMRKVTYRKVRLSRGRTDAAAAAAAAPHHPPPLLIKSPVHTGRLRTWLRLFPQARFVYVHRHPLEVFQSAANMADTYYPYTYLQRPTDDDTNDFILDQYELLYRSYMAERGRVPAGRLVEVSFAELEADPLAALRRVYSEFGWESRFESVAPLFRGYVSSLADFKKNHFSRLSTETEAVVRNRWRDSFEAFGYS